MHLSGAAAISCLAMLAMAGCGGPSEDELRAGVNEACANATPRIRGIGPLQGESRRSEADRALELAGALDAARSDIAAVDGPQDLLNDIDAYADHLSERQRGLEEAGELTAPPGRVAANLRMAAESFGDEADGLGLDDCVQMESALDEGVRAAPSG